MERDKGYIMLSRKFFSNKMWTASRAFNECEAWLDLIQSARFEASETVSRVGIHDITFGRGQYPAATIFLAKRWGWSEQNVKTFLKKLKREEMITTDSSQGVNVVTLCNYDEYNPIKSSDNQSTNQLSNHLNELNNSELQDLITSMVTNQLNSMPKSQPASNQKKNKDKNNIKKISTIVDMKEGKSKRFTPPTTEEVKSYCLERNSTVDAERFFNFYQSKDWMVGKNKMKDWKAAVRTWEGNEKKEGGKSDGTREYIIPD